MRARSPPLPNSGKTTQSFLQNKDQTVMSQRLFKASTHHPYPRPQAITHPDPIPPSPHDEPYAKHRACLMQTRRQTCILREKRKGEEEEKLKVYYRAHDPCSRCGLNRSAAGCPLNLLPPTKDSVVDGYVQCHVRGCRCTHGRVLTPANSISCCRSFLVNISLCS